METTTLPEPDEVVGQFSLCVTHDVYEIRKLKHEIHSIFDIGANVGMFSLAARVLFPLAKIIAVEPDPSNFLALTEHTRLWPQITCVQAALGRGSLYYRMGHGPSHGHHAFMTPSPVCGESTLASLHQRAPHGFPTATVATLAEDHGADGLLVKIDVEGNEVSLVDDDASNAVLAKARYVCIELHFFSPGNSPCAKTRELLTNWIDSFYETHVIATDFQSNGGMAFLTAK